MTVVKASKKLIQFDPKTFLSTINGGRKIVAFLKKQTIFAQGDPSDTVFYIQKRKVKLAVVSKIGKEATRTSFSEKRKSTLSPTHHSSAAIPRRRHRVGWRGLSQWKTPNI